MTFTLAAALYAGLVIWGEPGDGLDGAAMASGDDASLPEGAPATSFSQPVIVERAGRDGIAVTRAAPTETVVPEASVIAASAPRPPEGARAASPIGEPMRVSQIEPVAPVAPDAATGGADGERMVVTGSRVNLRAGPSTGDAVLDSLPRGTVVEVIGDAPGSWVELRDLGSGATGYMSSNFLAPA